MDLESIKGEVRRIEVESERLRVDLIEMLDNTSMRFHYKPVPKYVTLKLKLQMRKLIGEI